MIFTPDTAERCLGCVGFVNHKSENISTVSCHITRDGVSVCAKRNIIDAEHHIIAKHIICNMLQPRSFVSALRRNDVDLRSNDVACATQMMLCPADTNEKIQADWLGFFVRTLQNRCRGKVFSKSVRVASWKGRLRPWR